MVSQSKIEGIKYPPEPDEFYHVLKYRVQEYFKNSNKSRFGDHRFYLKAVFLIISFIGLYFISLFSLNITVAFICYILMGPWSILLGINVAHDAAHKSASSNQNINWFFLQLLDIVGANSYIWKRRHVHSHHIYPNIQDYDADLQQNPLVRIFPNDPIRPIHKYQKFYAPFLYLFYTLNWLLVRDFSDLKRSRIGSLVKPVSQRKEFIRLLLFKVFYFTYILIIPLLLSELSIVSILLGFVVMNILASLLITLALIPSHVAEDSEFPLPNEKAMMPDSWSHHQLKTAIDFATDNFFLNFFFGGFNHHVAHHLFPSVCHTHYTNITPIVKITAAEFGLAYRKQDHFLKAYFSHFLLLRNNGIQTKNIV